MLLIDASGLTVSAQALTMQPASIEAFDWLPQAMLIRQALACVRVQFEQDFHVLRHMTVMKLLCVRAALMQGMLQELPKMGMQKRPAARLMLETLLNAVFSIQSRSEETAETQQAFEVAVQVMCHISITCLTTPAPARPP